MPQIACHPSQCVFLPACSTGSKDPFKTCDYLVKITFTSGWVSDLGFFLRLISEASVIIRRHLTCHVIWTSRERTVSFNIVQRHAAMMHLAVIRVACCQRQVTTVAASPSTHWSETASSAEYVHNYIATNRSSWGEIIFVKTFQNDWIDWVWPAQICWALGSPQRASQPEKKLYDVARDFHLTATSPVFTSASVLQRKVKAFQNGQESWTVFNMQVAARSAISTWPWLLLQTSVLTLICCHHICGTPFAGWACVWVTLSMKKLKNCMPPTKPGPMKCDRSSSVCHPFETPGTTNWAAVANSK